jgi:hypothetical protein
MNVLFRQDASVKYKPVDAQGRRFFGADGAQAIPNGGLVYLGFMQYVALPCCLLPATALPLSLR